jgi:hypothetical protein
MTPSTHYEYLSHLSTQMINNADKPIFWEQIGTYAKEVSMLSELSLDSVRESLADLYCPTSNGDPKDPCAMLRSWLLMTLCREGSPTVWASRLRREPALAIMAGFVPGQIPCATTHINFLKRLLDGPYAVRKKQDVTRSRSLVGRHRRRLEDATKDRAAAAEAAGKTQSELLAHTLLEQTEQPRNPHELQTRLEHFFVQLALKPTMEADLLTDTLTVAGDGTAEPSAASKNGHRTCDCPKGSRCDCPRDYLSKTAQFCYDTQHGWTFGDRSYTISAYINGRDIPLMTIMPGGNESDFTLSLKALDRLLKMIEELDLSITITIFIGDGHHDAIGIYRYLKAKGIVPVIPLDEDSKPQQEHSNSKKDNADPKTPETPATKDSTEPSSDAKTQAAKNKKKLTPRPQIDMYKNITFEADGTPVCPGGCRMRYQAYNAAKSAHLFACPCTRKNGKQQWVFHAQECPFQQDCTPPEKKMGYTLYIKSEADLRLFPPILRASKRFKELAAQRSGSERQNAVADSYNLDRRHRNAAYTLIRLTLVNICKHARIREAEQNKHMAPQARLHRTLARLNLSELLPN